MIRPAAGAAGHRVAQDRAAAPRPLRAAGRQRLLRRPGGDRPPHRGHRGPGPGPGDLRRAGRRRSRADLGPAPDHHRPGAPGRREGAAGCAARLAAVPGPGDAEVEQRDLAVYDGCAVAGRRCDGQRLPCHHRLRRYGRRDARRRRRSSRNRPWPGCRSPATAGQITVQVTEASGSPPTGRPGRPPRRDRRHRTPAGTTAGSPPGPDQSLRAGPRHPGGHLHAAAGADPARRHRAGPAGRRPRRPGHRDPGRAAPAGWRWVTELDPDPAAAPGQEVADGRQDRAAGTSPPSWPT